MNEKTLKRELDSLFFGDLEILCVIMRILIF